MKLCILAIAIQLIVFPLHAQEPCTTCLSVQYNAQKISINNLLEPGSTTQSYFTEGLKALSNALPIGNERSEFFLLIDEIEANVIQNDTLLNETKLSKIAATLDRFFVYHHDAEDIVKYKAFSYNENGVAKEWGPFCNFFYIVDESNIGKFWKLATTPGNFSPCLLYDLILDASKENPAIRWKLFLEDNLCDMSLEMVVRILNVHYDVPAISDQLYMQALILSDYDMTLNQVQNIARAYYSAPAISCRRLKDFYSNYKTISSLVPVEYSVFTQILTQANNASLATFSTQQCVVWWSTKTAYQISSREKNIKFLNRLYWNIPFGSFFDNIVYMDCHQESLKTNAPNFFK